MKHQTGLPLATLPGKLPQTHRQTDTHTHTHTHTHKYRQIPGQTPTHTTVTVMEAFCLSIEWVRQEQHIHKPCK